MQTNVIFLVSLAFSNAICCLLPRPDLKVPSSHFGGEESSIENFPYQVQLEVDENRRWRFACDGVIYSEEIVISSASCLDIAARKEDGTDRLRFVAGQSKSGHTDDEDDVTAIHYAQKVIIHPHYNITIAGANDIGLVRVSPRFKFGTNIQPIAIVDEEPEVGEIGVGGGWGFLTGLRKHPEDVVRSINVQIIERKTCKAAYKNKTNGPTKLYEITDAILCVSYPNSRKNRLDSCVQENGAPLAINKKLAGLATLDLSCSEANPVPGLYTNIFHFKDWIESLAGKGAGHTYKGR